MRSRCSCPAPPPCRTCPGASGSGTWECHRAGRWTTAPSRSATGSWATRKARRGSSAPPPAPRCASQATRPCASPVPTWGRRSTARRSTATPRCTCTTGRCSHSATRSGPGLRAYVLVAGGFDVGEVLGSASTFTLGGFGGHGGRELRTGDVVHLHAGSLPLADPVAPFRSSSPSSRPTGSWRSSTARTRHPTSSPPTGSPPSTPPSGRCTTTRPAPACASWARRSSGPVPTVARPASTRRTCTTRPTPSARSTSPATCRSSSVPTDRVWAGSRARSPWSPPTGGSSGSWRPATT